MAKVSVFYNSHMGNLIDVVFCFNRTMLNLLSPRLDLIDGSRTVGRFDDVSGAPVIVTGYAYEDVSKIERMVNERSRWFSTRELRKCDAAVEDAYGEAVSGGDADWGMESDEMPGTPVMHWVTSPNRPEDNAPIGSRFHPGSVRLFLIRVWAIGLTTSCVFCLQAGWKTVEKDRRLAWWTGIWRSERRRWLFCCWRCGECSGGSGRRVSFESDVSSS